MSAMTSIGSAARRTAHSDLLEALTRVGLFGYGIFHLAIAWLAVQIATDRAPGHADQVGAFQFLEKQPLGRVLLVVIAVGLGAMAVWQLLLAAVGHRNYRGRRRVLERIASGGRVVIYGFLLWTDVTVLHGTARPSGQTQEHATAGVLAHPAGAVLVGLAGAVVAGIGIGMAVYGIKAGFRSKLALDRIGPRWAAAVVWLGRIGYAAKGMAFAVVGGLLIDAAVTRRSTHSRGLDGALRELAAQPFGAILLGLVAAGFAAFGIYCFAQVRVRRI